MSRADTKLRKYYFSVILGIVTLFLSAYSMAASIERADQKDVAMLLNAASGTNSAFWASFIGVTRGRVYIEYTTAVHAGSFFSDKPKHVVYWLPRSELSEEQLLKFKEYKAKFEKQQ